VLIVPRRAVLDGVYVYVVEDGRAVVRPLELGFVDYNFAEVKSGLKAGDLVIVEELEKFHDGQRVRAEATK
jgi:membrane fusion protein (multidrug efflux system)